MAITVTRLEYGDRQLEKNIYNLMRPLRVDLDASYVTGGYDVDLTAYAPFTIKEVVVNQYGGYHAEYDRATTKLVVTRGGSEVNAGVDLSSVYFILQLWGYRGFDQPAMAPTALIGAGGAPGAFTDLVFTGRMVAGIDLFADGDTTPSVRNGMHFQTQNTAPTTITSLDDIVAGQPATVLVNDANTIFAHGASLILNGGFAGPPAMTLGPMIVDDVVHFLGKSAGVARQVGIAFR
jgi:hypothetical protein